MSVMSRSRIGQASRGRARHQVLKKQCTHATEGVIADLLLKCLFEFIEPRQILVWISA